MVVAVNVAVFHVEMPVTPLLHLFVPAVNILR